MKGGKTMLAGRGVLALTLVVLAVAGSGLAPLAGAVYEHLPDLLTPERDYQEVPWTYDREEGSHLALHFRLPDNDFTHAIVRVVDGNGEELLHAYASSAVYISDGYGPDGEPRYIEASWVTTGWYRVDIVLNGTTYIYHDDSDYPRDPQQVEASLFKEATAGAFADPSTVVESGRVAQIERERAYGPDARVTTFREGLEGLEDWSAYVPDGDMEVLEKGSYMGDDRLRIEAGTSLENLTYIHTSAPDGAYVAEASFRPRIASRIALGGVPDHQAALAGISGPLGDPQVDWAVVMASNAPAQAAPWQSSVDLERPGTYWEWSAYFIDRDGTRTRLTPTWGPLDPLWHDVRVHVDPSTGTVEVQMDDNSTALRFDDAFTGASDRIATGDIWYGDAGMWWTGGRIGYYDNLAVDPAGDEA